MPHLHERQAAQDDAHQQPACGSGIGRIHLPLDVARLPVLLLLGLRLLGPSALLLGLDRQPSAVQPSCDLKRWLCSCSQAWGGCASCQSDTETSRAQSRWEHHKGPKLANPPLHDANESTNLPTQGTFSCSLWVKLATSDSGTGMRLQVVKSMMSLSLRHAPLVAQLCSLKM